VYENQAFREAVPPETLLGLANAVAPKTTLLDIAHLLTTSCIPLLAVEAAAVVVANSKDGLEVLSATNPAVHELEAQHLRRGQSPCAQAYHEAAPALVDDLQADGSSWPEFTRDALSRGYRALYAVPLRLRSESIGVLDLFRVAPGPLLRLDLHAGQALADMATIAVLHHRALHEAQQRISQLDTALTSRIIIEQAKGRLLERGALPSTDEAFARLRSYARRTNQRLTDVAHAVMNDHIDTTPILSPSPH
jgi:GAF domain-containing protein